MWNHKNRIRRIVGRKQADRRISPLIEAFEERVLLSGGPGILQGTVFLDNTGKSVDNNGTFDPSGGKTPQPRVGGVGATVALYQGTTTTGLPYATTTTDAYGNYSFPPLPTGQYTLVETPPSGYANDGTEVNSPLNPATGGTNSITVTVEDLSNLSVTFNAPYEVQNLSPGVLKFQASPNNGATYDNEDFLIGQMPITVTYPGGTTSQFASFCVNVFSALDYGVDTFSASGQPLGTALVPPTNAGAIAYLYQQYNSFLYQQFGQPISNPASAPTNPLTKPQALEAQALQLAIWKLIYDTGSNLQSFSSGNIINPFYDTTYNTYPGVHQNPPSITDLENQALSYINDALNNSPGQAIELDAISGTNGYQSLLAPGSLNFSNVPQATINTVIEDAATSSPPPAGGEGLGASVYDTATVTGAPSMPTPTGTVTYNFYTTASPVYGTTTPSSTQTVMLTGTGAVPNSATTPALTAGSYSYIGVYSGDSNYAGSVGAVEPVTVNRGSPNEGKSSELTEIFDSGGGAVTGALGEQVYDTATLTDIPFTPTGTVTYNFYTTASPVYGTTTPSSTQTVTLTGTGAVPNSVTTAALAAGSYSYIGVYSGDTNYTGSVGAVEPLTISQVTPSVDTTIVNANGSALTPPTALGTSVEDSVTFDSLVSGFTPTGTVTYTFSGSELASLSAPAGWTASSTTTWNETVNVNNGTIPNSAATGPLAAGTDYSFSATYTPATGATNYLTATSAPEPLTINQGSSSTVTTILDAANNKAPTGTLGESVYDTAPVTTAPKPFTATGTVTYTFTGTNGTSLAGLIPTGWTVVNSTTWTDTVTLNSGSVPNSAATPPLPAGSYQFEASYSGNGNYAASPLSAPEPLTIINVHPNLPTSIGGTVFCDCNNDGIQQPSETGIQGVTLTLTGTDNTGTAVYLVTTTNSQGSYDFDSLNPGTYIITESAPAGYFEGKNTAGTAGGTVSGDVISNITLIAGVNASGYNFADLTPSTVSGEVYYDFNQNGVLDKDDFGIAHVTMTLTGTNDLGQSIDLTTVTNNDGDYSFGDLRPGTYDIIRTQPAIFRGYKNAAGSLGGTVNQDSISDITVPACATGVGYLFGELQQPTCNLQNLAIHVGNVFWHFERTYKHNPAGFAKQYPNLVASIAAGQVPWGKAPFPSAPLASYWVPTLGTKPIKIFPVHGIKYNPLVSSTSRQSAVVKVAHAPTSALKPVTVHTPSVKPALLRQTVRK